MPRAFGKFIDDELTSRDWPQAEFSRKIKKDPGYVSKIITGKIKPPRKLLDSMADALRLDGEKRDKFMLFAALAEGNELVERAYLQALSEVTELRRQLRERRP